MNMMQVNIGQNGQPSVNSRLKLVARDALGDLSPFTVEQLVETFHALNRAGGALLGAMNKPRTGYDDADNEPFDDLMEVESGRLYEMRAVIASTLHARLKAGSIPERNFFEVMAVIAAWAFENDNGEAAAAPMVAAFANDFDLCRLFDHWRACWVEAREESSRCDAEDVTADEDNRRTGACFDACRDAAQAIVDARAEGMTGVDIKLSVLLVDGDDWIGEAHEALRSTLASLNGGAGSKYLPLALAARGRNASGGAA